MLMKLTILGNNSALPAFGRHPTAQIIDIDGELILLDCGENTQIQMQKLGIKWRRLNHIFISHLHGDHYFGLFGLINSMSLLGRTQPLFLYAPTDLLPLINNIMSVADTQFNYPLHFQPIEPETQGLLVDHNLFTVHCFPTEHRIACHGFVIRTQPKGRKLLPEQCKKYQIPQYFYPRLKQGEDYERMNGEVVANHLVTEASSPVKSYAYCADTIFTTSFLDHIKGVDVLYHECTYLEKDIEKAGLRFHSTAIQAATLAKLANVKQLLLGHYSSKYKTIEAFQEEAATVFSNVIATEEGTTYLI